MSKRRSTIVALALVIPTLALLGLGCSQQSTTPGKQSVKEEKGPIKLGWVGPLTGDVSSVGSVDKLAAELAVKEINEAGGINGRQLTMFYEDAACDAKTASSAGNKLINIEKVSAIIGGFCSGETLAIAPVAEQNKVVMISPASTAPSVTTAGDYIFRVIPSDSFQGKYAANFVYTTLNKKKAAVLYATTDYTEGIAKVFTEEYTKLGGEVVLADSFLQSDRDLKTQLTKVKNSTAEALYFATYTEAGVVGFKQAKQLGLTIPIIGAETFSDPKFMAAEGIEGAMYTIPVSKESALFKEKFLAATKQKEMTVYVTQTYDAVKLLAKVMAEVGSSSEAIKNELYKVNDYNGVSGNISLDSNGDLKSADYNVMVIKNQKSEKYQK